MSKRGLFFMFFLAFLAAAIVMAPPGSALTVAENIGILCIYIAGIFIGAYIAA